MFGNKCCRFKIGVYNVQYTNVGALIIRKGMGDF